MTSVPVPEVTEVSAPYWDGLKNGSLKFQHCADCGNSWLPARDACPSCLSPNYTWEPASGRAIVVSWVVYHRSFHPSFADRIPYNVAVIELEEGPRLISNVDAEATDLQIDLPVTLRIDEEAGFAIPRFTPSAR